MSLVTASASADLLEPSAPRRTDPHVLLETLRRSPEPMTARALFQSLTGPHRISLEELELSLQELVAAEKLVQHPEYRNQPRFWTGSVTDYIDYEIQRLLATQTKTKSEIKTALKNRLKGIAAIRIMQRVDALVSQGQVQKWPPALGKRTDVFSVLPIEADFYVEEAVQSLLKKLNKHGITQEALAESFLNIFATTTSKKSEASPSASASSSSSAAANLSQLILDRMGIVNPRVHQGDLVSLKELRRSLDFQTYSHADFDRAVLALQQSGQVVLSRHTHPTSLTEAEQAELVIDSASGHIFNGMTFARRS